MNSPVTIDVHGLTKRFGNRTVVNGFDLQLEQGRICGFLGPNGSGKTTTLRMICGLLIPDEGHGNVLEFDLLSQRAQIKREIGYMTQKFGLFEDLSIRENLDFVARIYQLGQRRDRVDETLDRLGLAARANQLAGKLSGGWKQRLALAACILHQPRILLLDEPTAGVDPLARREFWDQIHELARSGITVLVSTHYMDEAERCHEIAYIADGVLLARGTIDAVISGSGLHALTGTVAGADRLAEELQARPGVRLAVAFGTAIHVCGTDPDELRAAVAPWNDKISWQKAQPTLEDIFIDLMQQAPNGSLEVRS